jgi:hypothetical protein
MYSSLKPTEDISAVTPLMRSLKKVQKPMFNIKHNLQPIRMFPREPDTLPITAIEAHR